MSYTAQLTDVAASFREKMLQGGEGSLAQTDPEFVESIGNFALDEVVAETPLLDDRARFLCWIATCLGCGGVDAFRTVARGALNMGVEAAAIQEVVYQATAYLGIARTRSFLDAKNEVFEACGIELPLEPQATTTPDLASRHEGGEQAQVACFGEQMHGFFDRGNPDYPQINRWLVTNCFGDWYTRGGLSIPEREMVTFCFIAAQGGCESQLRSHTAANVGVGNNRAFLIQMVCSNLPFIGYPRTLNALAVVDEVTAAKE